MRRVALIIGLILAPAQAWAMNPGEIATAFRLVDAHGRPHRLGSFQTRILVVWYEGPQSHTQNQWVKNRLVQLQRLGKLDSRSYESIGIVNFHESALPSSIITRAIREHTRSSRVTILLDRDGRMRRQWGFLNGRSNVYVFDGRRRLIWKTSGPLTQRLGRQLIRMLVRLSR
ncbi:MAG: hypothetical protein ABI333_10140 [bacterium]